MRIADEIFFFKSFLDEGLGFGGREAGQMKRSSELGRDIAAIADAKGLGEFGNVEDGDLQQVSGADTDERIVSGRAGESGWGASGFTFASAWALAGGVPVSTPNKESAAGKRSLIVKWRWVFTKSLSDFC